MLQTIGEIGVLLVALGVIAFILHVTFAPKYVFVIVIEPAGVRVSKGKVPAERLDSIRALCREHGLTSGWIGGVARGKSISLRFSSNIPAAVQQRLRNLWFSG